MESAGQPELAPYRNQRTHRNWQGFNPPDQEPSPMSEATKVVLGTLGVAGLLSIALVVALVV